ncbi:hypothetical protein GCM10027443_05740 [Pontibacter brevis]
MAVYVQHMKYCSLVMAKGCVDTEDCTLLEHVMRCASLSKNKTVWVDCESISSLPTKSLRMLLSLCSKAESNGVTLLFYQFNPKINRIIEKAGLNSVLNILPTMADAYAYCRKKDASARG